MLVLTRRRGQSLAIGCDIEVKVLEIDHGKVRIGIDAPEDVRIERLDRRAIDTSEEKEAKHGK